jgi:SpoVK/Ycf46/Vps4 family AAA+-type ATPase
VFDLPLPDENGREAICRVLLADADLASILAKRTHGFTGADLAAAARRARLLALDREETIAINHLEEALCQASITK